MGDFFKGWRRKVGLLTLLMACVFMGGWVRSQDRFDALDICGETFRYGINSVDGRIRLLKTTPLEGQQLFAWTSIDASTTGGWGLDDNGYRKPYDPMNDYNAEWRMDWAGFHIGGYSTLRNAILFRVESCMFPYWSLVIPLTLISLWLFLSKPRQSTSMKITQPIPEKGA